MPPHNSKMDDINPSSKIIGVQFSMLSPDEIRKNSGNEFGAIMLIIAVSIFCMCTFGASCWRPYGTYTVDIQLTLE